jgi:MioC protein
MAADITILIGTMTGTAELVAEEVEAVLGERGHAIDIVDMEGLDASVFYGGRIYLFCTSTYGQGDVPDNARGLYEDLKEGRPDMSAIRYGIIGLGDSTYADTFNFGAKLFDEVMSELGARRLGERLEHNASGDDLPEEAAVAWAREWRDLLD